LDVLHKSIGQGQLAVGFRRQLPAGPVATIRHFPIGFCFCFLRHPSRFRPPNFVVIRINICGFAGHFIEEYAMALLMFGLSHYGHESGKKGQLGNIEGM
jgi:hypothetical protein